jgi:hypothetical protein
MSRDINKSFKANLLFHEVEIKLINILILTRFFLRYKRHASSGARRGFHNGHQTVYLRTGIYPYLIELIRRIQVFLTSTYCKIIF